MPSVPFSLVGNVSISSTGAGVKIGNPMGNSSVHSADWQSSCLDTGSGIGSEGMSLVLHKVSGLSALDGRSVDASGVTEDGSLVTSSVSAFLSAQFGSNTIGFELDSNASEGT